MSFITSRLTFGGYAFPSAMMLDYRQADSTLDIVKLPYQQGSNIPPGTASEKYISVKGMIGGSGAVDSSGAYIITRDQLEAEMNLLQSALESGYQQLSVGATPARYLVAQKYKLKITYSESGAQCYAMVEIQFIAQDPRWIASAGSSLGTTSGTLTSNGSAVIFPKFTITGASANATITVTPAGYGGIKLALTNGAISSGSLIVDTDPRNRANALVFNGVANLALLDYVNTQNNNGDSAFFPYMRPGSNTLASTGISAMTTSWSDAWVF
jgi:hypothetical protein